MSLHAECFCIAFLSGAEMHYIFKSLIYSDKAIIKIQVARRSASDGPPRPAQQHLGISHLDDQGVDIDMRQGDWHFIAFLKCFCTYWFLFAFLGVTCTSVHLLVGQKATASGSFVPTHAEYTPQQIQLDGADDSCPGPACQVFPLCVG